MKYLNNEESEKLIILNPGRYSWLYAALLELEVGKGLTFTKEEWVTKTPPNRTVRRVEKKYNRRFKFGLTPDCKGWGVIRLE